MELKKGDYIVLLRERALSIAAPAGAIGLVVKDTYIDSRDTEIINCCTVRIIRPYFDKISWCIYKQLPIDGIERIGRAKEYKEYKKGWVYNMELKDAIAYIDSSLVLMKHYQHDEYATVMQDAVQTVLKAAKEYMHSEMMKQQTRSCVIGF